MTTSGMTSQKISRQLLATIAMLFVLLAAAATASGEDIAVSAVAEARDVYVGQPFQLRIEIEGSDNAAQPDLSSLQDFTVTPLGGQSTSATSITVVNGKTSRLSRRGYVYRYRLVANRAGRLRIPAINVEVEGRTHKTEPVTITARPPEETDDFKLRLRPAKRDLYVGEAVGLTVTWYVGRDVENFSLTLPLLEDDRFQVIVPDGSNPAGRQDDSLAILLGRQRIIAKKGRGTLDGKDFLTVSFAIFLIPRQAGVLTLPQAIISADVVTGYQRRRDPFGMPFGFDDFFNRKMTRTVVVPSDTPTLTVRPLPSAGRPADFSGLVGRYSLAAEADPRQVNVGDPITLTIMVTGPRYLDNVRLPDLRSLPGFSENFKIPAEIAPGRRQGRQMVFVQTIRARTPDVNHIPPVTLSFFNPESGVYETAATEAIPITVRPTRIVTAADAEAAAESTPALSSPSRVSEQRSGIFSNYDGADVLLPQPRPADLLTLTPARLLLLLLPPGLFLAATGLYLARRRRSSRQAAGRRALTELRRRLPTATSNDAVWNALQRYLAARLNLAAGTITMADIEPVLRRAGTPATVLHELASLLEECEAGRFGGRACDPADLRQRLLRLAPDLDKALAASRNRGNT